jgi:signal transduction histidine kinase
VVHELADRTRRLGAEDEASVRRSVEGGRASIARDLHDIVSHHLAVMVIQAGLAAGRFATICGAYIATTDVELTGSARNDAAVASPISHTGSGLGLTGMRERPTASGGSLTAGPDGEGGLRRAGAESRLVTAAQPRAHHVI